MNVIRTLMALVRGKPLTPEELAERAEAQALKEEMLQDRISQRSGAGSVYRSERR